MPVPGIEGRYSGTSSESTAGGFPLSASNRRIASTRGALRSATFSGELGLTCRPIIARGTRTSKKPAAEIAAWGALRSGCPSIRRKNIRISATDAMQIATKQPQTKAQRERAPIQSATLIPNAEPIHQRAAKCNETRIAAAVADLTAARTEIWVLMTRMLSCYFAVSNPSATKDCSASASS